jgi:hypothetical protein
MARVKLSALFTSIAGRFGGGVFRNWKGLTVLGVLPDSVHNPNSDQQVKFRGLLTCISKKWSALSIAVKEQWATVAIYLTEQWGNYENEVGSHVVIRTPRGPYTALGALVTAHSLLGSTGNWTCTDALLAPPVGFTAPAQPLGLAATGDTDGIICTWDDPASWGDGAGDGDVRIWAKSEDGTFFAQLSGSAAGGVETYTITELTPVGGTQGAPLRPGLYFVQADAVSDPGFRSPPSAVFKIVIADPVPP